MKKFGCSQKKTQNQKGRLFHILFFLLSFFLSIEHMTLDTSVRNYLREKFGRAFSDKCSGIKDMDVLIVDFMQFVKVLNGKVVTRDHLVAYFVDLVKYMCLESEHVFKKVIVMVDGLAPPVKFMVEHKKRYAKVDLLDETKGPYLVSLAGSAPLPFSSETWMQFAGNAKLLRRELYPLIFNALVGCRRFTPRPGQSLILSGFPGRSEWRHVDADWAIRTQRRAVDGRALLVIQWPEGVAISEEMETADPELYHRTYVVENLMPCQLYPHGTLSVYEWCETKNDIGEADVRMFYFDHWFPNQNILFSINDGDVFSIGLLYSVERFLGLNEKNQYCFRNRHAVCLPLPGNKKRNKQLALSEKEPVEEFVDLNMLYEAVCEHTLFKGKVQNPVTTLVFLIIMSGSDFFQHFLKGMGTHTVVWPAFFTNITCLAHLVQMATKLEPGTRTPREIVMDEDVFRQYIRWCYLLKYEKSVLASQKKQKLEDATLVTLDRLRQRTQVDAGNRPKEDTEYHMPSRNTIRAWCRQIEWNLLYWRNAPLGQVPSPFQQLGGFPYFPYAKEPGTNKPLLLAVVASASRPVDPVFEQHLYRHVTDPQRKQILQK